MPADHIPEKATEITPAMKDAGADVILAEQGVADLGVSFSAPDLAERVYLAMARERRESAKSAK